MTGHPWNDHPANQRIGGVTKDQRQHSACPVCYSDCISPETTLVLTFTCANGHQHTTTRGASIKHSAFLNRFSVGVDRNL